MNSGSATSGTTAAFSARGQDGVGFAQQHNLALFPAPLLGFPEHRVQLFGTALRLRGVQRLGRRRSESEHRKPVSMGRQRELDARPPHREDSGADVRRQRFDTLEGTPFFGQEIFGATFTSSSNAPGSGLPLRRFPVRLSELHPGHSDDRLGPAAVHLLRRLRAGRLEGHPAADLNLGLRYELFTQPVDARDLGSLFNIQNGQYALPGQGRLHAARSWMAITTISARAPDSRGRPRANSCCAAAYGLFYGERDQNQQVTQFSGNFPNVPVVSLPTISATQTVAPPYTINTPIPVVPTDPSLASFTPANPFVGTIRSQGFHDARDPMVHQYNFNIQYQVDGIAAARSLVQRRCWGAIFRACSST